MVITCSYSMRVSEANTNVKTTQVPNRRFLVFMALFAQSLHGDDERLRLVIGEAQCQRKLRERRRRVYADEGAFVPQENRWITQSPVGRVVMPTPNLIPVRREVVFSVMG